MEQQYMKWATEMIKTLEEIKNDKNNNVLFLDYVNHVMSEGNDLEFTHNKKKYSKDELFQIFMSLSDDSVKEFIDWLPSRCHHLKNNSKESIIRGLLN